MFFCQLSSSLYIHLFSEPPPHLPHCYFLNSQIGAGTYSSVHRYCYPHYLLFTSYFGCCYLVVFGAGVKHTNKVCRFDVVNRPPQIARISFCIRFQGGRRHSVAKHLCLPKFLNIVIARTCGGAKIF